ncbi:hypothetical protein XENTR_v10003941 [Xenopus tropicalis]|nr:hypothetical protein XENTR_v10003941 [Xenopus tropicalis]
MGFPEQRSSGYVPVPVGTQKTRKLTATPYQILYSTFCTAYDEEPKAPTSVSRRKIQQFTILQIKILITRWRMLMVIHSTR